MDNKFEKLTEEEKSLFDVLIEKYSLTLNVEDTQKVLNESRTTLYRKRKSGLGPKFIQDSTNHTVRYPLHEIVRYICNTKKTGANNEIQKG